MGWRKLVCCMVLVTRLKRAAAVVGAAGLEKAGGAR